MQPRIYQTNPFGAPGKGRPKPNVGGPFIGFDGGGCEWVCFGYRRSGWWSNHEDTKDTKVGRGSCGA